MTANTAAARLIQSAGSASLGTLDQTLDSPAPFVSLVTVAATGPTSLALLLSGLAKHTQNLATSEHASLLIREETSSEHRDQGDSASQDPMAAARVTLTGTVHRLSRQTDTQHRTAFLSRHPSASMYADFGDFAFYEFRIRQAHLIAGFGRIETIDADELASP